MSQYQDSGWRQTDGAYAQKFWVPVPFAAMREVVSNDLSGTTSIGAAGSAGIAITSLLHKHSTPALEFGNGDTDSAIRLAWASSNSDAVAFQVPLPPHLDPSEDLTIKVYGIMAGTTDAVVLAADTFFDIGDTKVEDNSGTLSGTAAAQLLDITIASADIPIGARTMSVELTPGAHTTDAMYMYSCWVEGTLLP